MPIPRKQWSPGQRQMVEDGFPAALLLSSDERAGLWRRNPPKPIMFNDPLLEQQRALRDQQRREAASIRITKLKASLARKRQTSFDHSNHRWDSIRNRWVPIESLKEDDMAKRWKVIPYNETGEIIQRGVTSIAEGTAQVELLAKMAHSYHRCAKGTVKKVVVMDAADGIVRTWDAATDSPLPPPEKTTEAEPAAPAPKNSRSSVNGKTPPAAKSKGKSGGGGKKGKGPGVIATIAELLAGAGKKGLTIDEMVDHLAKKFPDREAKSMRSTVSVQMGRQGASRRKDEKRGVVFSK